MTRLPFSRLPFSQEWLSTGHFQLENIDRVEFGPYPRCEPVVRQRQRLPFSQACQNFPPGFNLPNLYECRHFVIATVIAFPEVEIIRLPSLEKAKL